jgi:hypothetical protein
VQPTTLLKVVGLFVNGANVADKFEEIRERAKRGRYGGHTGSLTVLKYEDVTWLFKEIERLREENSQLTLLVRTSESGGKERPTNLDTGAAK